MNLESFNKDMFEYLYVVAGCVNGEIYTDLAKFSNPFDAINYVIKLTEENTVKYNGYDDYVICIEKMK